MTATRVLAVLSGGGAKAAAHLGALEALAAAGLTPERFIATSMGAVVAAAVAAGQPPGALVSRLTQIGARGLVRTRFASVGGLFVPSLLRPDALRAAIRDFIGVESFAELRVPLTVTAVELETGALVRYGAGGEAGPLIDVLTASCALPVYFPPVVIDGRRLVDGGLRAVLPLDLAADLPAGLVVAVDVGPGFDLAPGVPGAPVRIPPLLRAHEDAVGILMAGQTAAELARWHAAPGRPPILYVRPRIERGATFRIDQALAYATEGRRATEEALAAWQPRP